MCKKFICIFLMLSIVCGGMMFTNVSASGLNYDTINLIGNTYSDIQDVYGEFSDVFYDGGAAFYIIKDTNISLAFYNKKYKWVYCIAQNHTPSKNKHTLFDEPVDDAVCVSMWCHVSDIISGMGEQKYSARELSEISGVNFSYEGISMLDDYHMFGADTEYLSMFISSADGKIDKDDGVMIKAHNYDKVPKNKLPMPISVYLDNVQIEFDVPPVIEEGRTLVPVRALTEAMGMSVKWDEATQTVTIYGEEEIKITIGSKDAYINGKRTYLDVPAKTVEGRTIIPLRFVAEMSGATVMFVEEENRVNVVYPRYTISNKLLPGFYYNGNYYINSSKALPLVEGFDVKDGSQLKGSVQYWCTDIINGGASIRANYDLSELEDGQISDVYLEFASEKRLADTTFKNYFKRPGIRFVRRNDKAYVNAEDLAMLTGYRIDNFKFIAERYNGRSDFNTVKALLKDDFMSNPIIESERKWGFDNIVIGWTDRDMNSYMNNQTFWGGTALTSLAAYDFGDDAYTYQDRINDMVDILLTPSDAEISENIQSKITTAQNGQALLKLEDFLAEGVDKTSDEVFDLFSDNVKNNLKTLYDVDNRAFSIQSVMSESYLEATEEVAVIQAVLEVSEGRRQALIGFLNALPQYIRDENSKLIEAMEKRLLEYRDYEFGAIQYKKIAENGIPEVLSNVFDKTLEGEYGLAWLALDTIRYGIDNVAADQIQGIKDAFVFEALYDFDNIAYNRYKALWDERKEYGENLSRAYQFNIKNAAIVSMMSGNQARKMFIKHRKEIWFGDDGRECDRAGYEGLDRRSRLIEKSFLPQWLNAIVE